MQQKNISHQLMEGTHSLMAMKDHFVRRRPSGLSHQATFASASRTLVGLQRRQVIDVRRASQPTGFGYQNNSRSPSKN